VRFLGLGQELDAAGLGVEPMLVVEISQVALRGPRLAGGNGGVQQLDQAGSFRFSAGGGHARVGFGRGGQTGGLVEREQLLVLK